MSHSLLLLHSEDAPYASQCRSLFAAQLQAGAQLQRLALSNAATHQTGAAPAPDLSAHAPDQIVICAPAQQAWAWIARQASAQADLCPITLLSDWPEAPSPAALQHLHLLAGWWPLGSLTAEQLPTALALDRQRWLHARKTEQALQNTQVQLEERKWIERAKGRLTEARGIGEEQAFALLRNTAMQAHLKLGNVSRQVVEAADWADAINRAGQFRMLSQRLVKLQAMRLADIDALASSHQLQEAFDKGEANLKRLQTLRQHRAASEALDQALATTERQWHGLSSKLGLGRHAPPPTSDTSLEDTNAKAEHLLLAAEHLTQALEQQSGRKALHVVNLCGRQRMRIQRLAKEALLAHLLGNGPAPGMQAHMLDFEAALQELDQLPLSNAEIRYLLSEARLAWHALIQGMDHGRAPTGLNALVHTSDTVLQLLEQLTSAYEHSLQVMLA
ncbi:MAG: ANTAR domain-containing protein [Burkholderiaceae bacterium]|nr:ANTAR domain-containing protein [Burkholderiaceae bacterium]